MGLIIILYDAWATRSHVHDRLIATRAVLLLPLNLSRLE